MNKHTPNILEYGDARWLASVIDCEGSICRCSGGGIRCIVSMVNNKMVMECFRIAGCGFIGKSILKSGHTAWSWSILPSYGRVIIEQVSPYLIEKKEQAELFIRWPLLVSRNCRGGLPAHIRKERDGIQRRIKYLNHSGHQHQPNYENVPINSCVIQATL